MRRSRDESAPEEEEVADAEMELIEADKETMAGVVEDAEAQRKGSILAYHEIVKKQNPIYASLAPKNQNVWHKV